MSRSTSFWPSTMATRSSSACVALNSMRFMVFSRRSDAAGQAGGRSDGARDYARRDAIERRTRAKTTARRQRWLPADESGRGRMVAGQASASRVARRCGLVVLSGLRCSRSSGESGGRRSALRLRERDGDSLRQKFSLQCAAQCAASNRPLPGAETALFLYHRYFSGAQRPDGQWI